MRKVFRRVLKREHRRRPIFAAILTEQFCSAEKVVRLLVSRFFHTNVHLRRAEQEDSGRYAFDGAAQSEYYSRGEVDYAVCSRFVDSGQIKHYGNAVAKSAADKLRFIIIFRMYCRDLVHLFSE